MTYTDEPTRLTDLTLKLENEQEKLKRCEDENAKLAVALARERKDWAFLIDHLGKQIELYDTCIEKLANSGQSEKDAVVSLKIELSKEKIQNQLPKNVEKSGYKVYSQSDEDGIIEEIFKRIGTTNYRFVEVGAENGLENNTRFLLEQGWTGVWIEAVAEHVHSANISFAKELQSQKLKIVNAFVTAENINDILREAGLEGAVDLLSIDISGNDYHIWRAIEIIKPRVVVLEHNSRRPPENWIMPYEPNYKWDERSANYGASLSANVRLAFSKGYRIVAAGLYSSNAFYVLDEICGENFPSARSAASFWRPLDYPMIRDFPRRSGPVLEPIDDVAFVTEGKETDLPKVGGLLSKIWKKIFQRSGI